MNFGGSIILAVVGAIMYFAINEKVSGIELSTIGIILMVAGAAWFVIALMLEMSARSGRTVERRVDRDEFGEKETIRER